MLREFIFWAKISHNRYKFHGNFSNGGSSLVKRWQEQIRCPSPSCVGDPLIFIVWAQNTRHKQFFCTHPIFKRPEPGQTIRFIPKDITRPGLSLKMSLDEPVYSLFLTIEKRADLSPVPLHNRTDLIDPPPNLDLAPNKILEMSAADCKSRHAGRETTQNQGKSK